MSRFSNSRGSGFHLTFDNNWTVSVQFNGGHYCDNYDKMWNFAREQVAKGDSISSSTAEIAVWSNRISDSGLTWLENDTVRGYCTTNEVAQVIHKVSTAKSTLTNKQMTKRLSKIWK
tara:strand:+ start:186 stop:536 length:351 start_codon:yes stop_codon:yes gene_type:complete